MSGPDFVQQLSTQEVIEQRGQWLGAKTCSCCSQTKLFRVPINSREDMILCSWCDVETKLRW